MATPPSPCQTLGPAHQVQPEVLLLVRHSQHAAVAQAPAGQLPQRPRQVARVEGALHAGRAVAGSGPQAQARAQAQTQARFSSADGQGHGTTLFTLNPCPLDLACLPSTLSPHRPPPRHTNPTDALTAVFPAPSNAYVLPDHPPPPHPPPPRPPTHPPPPHPGPRPPHRGSPRTAGWETPVPAAASAPATAGGRRRGEEGQC